MLVQVGVSHRHTPIQVRERVALTEDGLRTLLGRLLQQPSVMEACVLSTCNRMEIYAFGPAPSPGSSNATQMALTGALRELGGHEISSYLQVRNDREAIAHLFRVASSLESMVVGEPQILGQLRQSVLRAKEVGSLGPNLSGIMQAALLAGRRVRRETGIGHGQVSIPSVAMDLAGQIFGELQGKHALLLGAGDMAENAARLVTKAGARLTVCNRSADKGLALARKLGAAFESWDRLGAAISTSDMVIASTASPQPIVTADLVREAMRARRNRSLFLIDIAVPRDVEEAVQELDNVYLYDIDDLSKVVDEGAARRSGEVERAQQFILSELSRFDQRTRERAAVPIIVDLRTRILGTLHGELMRSLATRLKHLGPEDRAALETMLEAATAKVLHRPVTRLKGVAGNPAGLTYEQTLRDLFDLSGEEPRESLDFRAPESAPERAATADFPTATAESSARGGERG